MTHKSETLRDEYRMRFAGNEQYRNNVWKILCAEYFQTLVSTDAHVFDLGCGWGEFINNIKAAKKLAMDLNPDTKSRLAAGVHFFCQDCAQEWPIEQASLDVVFTSNFLEHLPDKAHVERAIAEAYRCLKDDGLIICVGPNIKCVPGTYWDFWDHFVPITDLSLSEVLKLKGFNIQERIPRFLPYSMSAESPPPLFMVSWYLKLRAFWPVFGKQFLVVGRKTPRVGRSDAAEVDSGVLPSRL